jgi:phage gp36-like protein
MPSPLAITLHASGAETVSGTGTSVDLADRTLVELTLDLTAISGTSAALAVTVETSMTGSDWSYLGKFETLGAAGARTLLLPVTKERIRARWVLTGTTPSTTFSVAGTAQQLYALPSDLMRFGLPARALESVPMTAIVDACFAASEEAAGYLGSAYSLPLASWGVDLRMHVAKMAAYNLMSIRGYDPDSGQDRLLQVGRDQAVTWLNRVADGKLRPMPTRWSRSSLKRWPRR